MASPCGCAVVVSDGCGVGHRLRVDVEIPAQPIVLRGEGYSKPCRSEHGNLNASRVVVNMAFSIVWRPKTVAQYSGGVGCVAAGACRSATSDGPSGADIASV